MSYLDLVWRVRCMSAENATATVNYSITHQYDAYSTVFRIQLRIGIKRNPGSSNSGAALWGPGGSFAPLNQHQPGSNPPEFPDDLFVDTGYRWSRYWTLPQQVRGQLQWRGTSPESKRVSNTPCGSSMPCSAACDTRPRLLYCEPQGA